MTIHAGHSAQTGPSPQTKQVIYRTHSLNKLEIVARILQAEGRGLTMIFTRTKRNADRVAEDLDFRGFAVAAVHGDLGQGARERALRAFRVGKIDVLVATDVAARGLDVTGVTHVINYDCPEDPDTYTHRIGRTGRAGATGVAVTFVDWEDMPRWRLIDKSMGMDLPEPPETYHTSPWLFTDLDIPTSVSGTLPTADRTRAGLSAEVEEDLGGGHGRARPGAAGTGRGRPRRRGGSSGTPAGSGRESGSATETGSDEDSARSTRQRRRRRAGETVSGSEHAESTVDTPVTAVADGDSAPAKARRRRRRRGGARPAGTTEPAAE
jgi:superfamily II DNA/RNA helicase